MASCKECLHIDVCEIAKEFDFKKAKRMFDFNCEHFKDCTQFVELTCKVGDTVYFATKDKFNSATIDEITITENGLQFYWIQYDKSYETTEIWDDGTFSDKDIGKTVFLTPEAAEKALNSSENPNSRKEKTNG